MAEENKKDKSIEKIDVHIDKGIANIVPEFLEHRRQDCKEMLQALNAKDFDAVKLCSHKMRGSGGTYGFDEISNIGAEIENLVVDIGKHIERIEEQISSLLDYLEKVNVVYD